MNPIQKRLLFLLTGTLVFLSFLLIDPLNGYGQLPTIGVPYSADSNTVVLMHFDGNLQVESGMQVAQQADQVGTHVFLPDSSMDSSFGGSLYLANERDEYNAVTIPDTADLDLDNNWTFNAWIRADKWASPYTDGGPRILHKPGSPFYHSNWYFAPYPDGHLKSGFRHENDWFELNSNPDIIQPDRWYHITYIRDTSRDAVIQMIHDRDGNLLAADKKSWGAGGDNPTNTDKPLYIGLNPKNGNGTNQKWIGNIDEVWISNTVRQYSNVQIPFFENAVRIDKTISSDDTLHFGIEVDWYGPGSEKVRVYLNYNQGNGWEQLELPSDTNGTYRGTLSNLQAGTVMEYYYSAEIDGNSKGRYPGDELYHTVVEAPQSKLLKLSFEQGSGAPIDSTIYHDVLQVFGGPGNAIYSDDAMDGSYAYELDGQNDLLLDSFLLNDETYTISLWFKTTSELPEDGARLLAKEVAGDSSKVNYALLFQNHKLTARSTFSHSISVDTTLQPNTWYRAVYMVSSDAVSLQLFDLDGRIGHTIEPLYVSPYNQDGPLYIGQGRYQSELGFKGLVDQVQIWNYPALDGPFLIQSVTRYVNQFISDEPYPIDTYIFHTGRNEPTVRLHYLDKQGWHAETMQQGNLQGQYTATISPRTSRTIIPYYVEVYSGDQNFITRKPEGAGSYDAAPNYELGIVEKYDQLLDIDFETFRSDTSLPIPLDQSPYADFHRNVQLIGRSTSALPEKSTDAIQGKHSMYFGRQDSAYLALDSPFLSAHDFTLSFWFKPSDDLLGKNERLVSRQGGLSSTSFWWISNFDVRINKSKQVSGFYSFSNCLECEKPTTDTTVRAGRWYRVIYEYHTGDSTYIQLRDAQNRIIDAHGTANVDGPPLKTNGVFSVAHAGTKWDPYFSGHIDDITLYNYAVTLDPPVINNVTELGAVHSGEGPFDVQARVSNGGQAPTLHYRTGSAAPWETRQMRSSDSIYAASLPDFEAGTVVDYYVKTQNNYGTVTISPNDTSGDNFYHAYYGEENTAILDLTFEDASAPLKDQSLFRHQANWESKTNQPSLSDYALRGDRSLRFRSADSTYLEFNSRWLSPEIYTIDVWFSMSDTSNREVRLLNKQSVGDIWWEPTFTIMGLGNGSWIGGAYHPREAGSYQDKFSSEILSSPFRELALNDSTWYHAQLVREQDSVHFTLLTGQQQIIKQASAAFSSPVNQTDGPFRIGHAGLEGQPYFDGWIDRIRILNYADKTFVEIPDQSDPELPSEYHLHANYPNPFNPITTIRYELPKPARVTLSVYTLLGRKVTTLVNGKKKAGQHRVTFDGENLSSGIYIYRLQAEDFSASKKMLLVK